MGGGDLNLKKSWHTQTLHNIERVWKAEQRDAEEKKKTDQLRRELAEERQLADLQKMQEAAGLVKKRPDRLDWMYAGAIQTNTEVQEEYLLGKRRVDRPNGDGSAMGELPVVANSLSEPAPEEQTNRDAMTKIREDPMLMIKRREMMSLKEILDNPIRLKQLRELNAKKKEQKKSDKKDKKKHSKKNQSGSDNSDDSDASERQQQSSSRSVSSGTNREKDRLEEHTRGNTSHHHDEASRRSDNRRDDDRRPGHRHDETRRRDEWHDSRQSPYHHHHHQQQRHHHNQYSDRHGGGAHKKPTMTAEEREARLAAMKADASWNAGIRQQKLEEDATKDEQERARLSDNSKRNRDVDVEFLQDVKRKAYTDKDSASLAERVQRNRHYLERGGQDH